MVAGLGCEVGCTFPASEASCAVQVCWPATTTIPSLPRHNLLPPLIPQVLRLECAAEFSEPVDLKAFPDYAEEVTQPMDLGTVKVGGCLQRLHFDV